jgi:hypothetical protein
LHIIPTILRFSPQPDSHKKLVRKTLNKHVGLVGESIKCCSWCCVKSLENSCHTWHRNDCVFNGASPTVATALPLAKYDTQLWSMSGARASPYVLSQGAVLAQCPSRRIPSHRPSRPLPLRRPHRRRGTPSERGAGRGGGGGHRHTEEGRGFSSPRGGARRATEGGGRLRLAQKREVGGG